MATPEEEQSMPFWSHLDELRKRLARSLIGIAVGFALSFRYSEDILRVLLWPMNTKWSLQSKYPYVLSSSNVAPQKLHYATLIEPFWAHIKIALIAGLMLVFPFVMYQLWKFLSPGLLPKERRFVGYFVVLSTVFFSIGVLFCYLALLPMAIPFLLTYKTEDLTAILRIGDYIDFVLKFLLASGIVFELPLIIVLLSRMGIVTPDTLAKHRRIAVLGSFVVGAILTPTPDIFNQTLLSVPIYLLYELGILASRIFGRRKKPGSAVQEA
jgi:sec-independent protein translocase protein TatC